MNTTSSNQQWSLIKRLFELWNGDPDFRHTVEYNFSSLTGKISFSNESIVLARKLWQEHSFTSHTYTRKSFPELHSFLDHQGVLKNLRAQIRSSCDPLPPKFSKWRHRQMNRCDWQLGPEQNKKLIHMPICFELSRGCSVGCWFCGLQAPQLKAVFPHTRQNKKLWYDVLQISHDLLGTAATNASLYWATEPFDNPDYELFCLDFHAVFGVFPQTTTALALADIKRTRSFIRLSQKNGCKLNRFSVNSIEDLHSLHEHYSAFELAQVELVLQNRGSLQNKARSGRLLTSRSDNLQTETISCCTGFLVNMVRKRVYLISPCPASAKYPKGYITFAEGAFQSADEFSALLQEMMDSHMANSFSSSDPVVLTDGIRCQSENKKTVFRSSRKDMIFQHDDDYPGFVDFLNNQNAGTIVHHYLETRVMDPAITFNVLNTLLNDGILHTGIQQ